MGKKSLLVCLGLCLFASQAMAEKVANPYDYVYTGRWNLTVVTSGENTGQDQQLEHLLATSQRLQSMLSQVI